MDLITQRISIKDALPEKVLSDYKEKYGVKDDSVFIRKGYIPDEIKFVEGEKAVISYINTAGIDRDAEVTLPEGAIMDAYKENPVVMFGHDYKELPIGKCEKLRLDSKGWQGKTIYANTPKANEVFEYRKAGFPLAESVGFIPIESINAGESGFDELAKDLAKRGAFKRSEIDKIRRIHKKWLMLEYSDVPIPSNPEALQVAIAKGLVLPEFKDDIGKNLIDDIRNAEIVDLTVITKPEENENTIRIPVSEGHDGHKIRTIQISQKEGIQGLYCIDDKVVITYLFDKSKGWDMDKARSWIKEHKSLNVEHGISQNEILDEIDYLKLMLDESGASDKVKESLQRVAQKYLDLGLVWDGKTIQPRMIIKDMEFSKIEESNKEQIKDANQDATIPVNSKEDIVSPKSETPTLEEILNEIKNTKLGG